MKKPEAREEKESPRESEAEESQASEKAKSKLPTPVPRSRPPEKPLWGKADSQKDEKTETEDPFEDDISGNDETTERSPQTQLKLGSDASGSQSELSFENAPRGRFEGENPNVVDGEDLDLPPFLRKKKS